VTVLARAAALYRFFDYDGRLLYVGITYDRATRFESHAQTSKWWKEADHGSTTVEWLESWRAAEVAERFAIRDERPLWNRRGSPWAAVADADGNLHVVPKPKTKTRSRHSSQVGVMARTEPEVRDAANAALEARGWDLKQFLIAALKAVADKPEQLLALLDDYRPPPRRRGRPPADPE
jgi:predicted GIY-YIG superfamily endonuclease